MGFAVVMAVLAIMWLIMVLLGMFFAGKKPAAPAQPAAPRGSRARCNSPGGPPLQAQQASAEDTTVWSQ
jgi:Na+-transporting methylmalonyl-CoA/oxaloacetate decarboxylase gamma subunit